MKKLLLALAVLLLCQNQTYASEESPSIKNLPGTAFPKAAFGVKRLLLDTRQQNYCNSKAKSVKPKDKNCKYILHQIKKAPARKGVAITAHLLDPVPDRKKLSFFDMYALEALYQPYFQRTGSTIILFQAHYDNGDYITDIQLRNTRLYNTAQRKGRKADRLINNIVKEARKRKGKKAKIIFVNNAIKNDVPTTRLGLGRTTITHMDVWCEKRLSA